MKAFWELILTAIIAALFASIVAVPANFVIERIINPELTSLIMKFEWLDRNSLKPIRFIFLISIIYPIVMILIWVLFHKTSVGRNIMHRFSNINKKLYHFPKKVSSDKKDADQEK